MANLQETLNSTKANLEGLNKQTQEYSASWEKVGATANTALSLIASSIKDTNPALSSMLGSVQKLIPNLTELGNAASKSGSLLKAAMSPAGVMLLITAITTLITDFDNITEALGITTEQANKFKEAIVKIGGVVGGVVKIMVDNVKKLISVFKKIFKGDFKGAFEDIKTNFKDAFKVSTYVDSFKEGQKVGENMAKGLMTKKKDVKKATEEVVDPVVERLKELIKLSQDYVRDTALQQVASDLKIVQDQINSMSDQDPEKNYWVQVLKELRTQAMNLGDGVLPKVSNGLDELGQASTKTAGIVKKDLSGMTNETKIWKDGSLDAFDHLKKNATEYLDAAANLTDGLAQLLESDEKSAKKNAKKIKGLKIATATMDMLSGAIKAFTSAQELGPIAGPIVGGINAAAVVAMGIANINKIKNTNTDSGPSSTPTVSTPTPSVSQSYISNSGYQESVDAAKATAQNTSQSNVVPVLVVDDVNKVQKDMSVVQTNSSF